MHEDLLDLPQPLAERVPVDAQATGGKYLIALRHLQSFQHAPLFGSQFRYSSDMQNTSESIEVQIGECKKYALAHGIVINREPFVNRAETGTSTENRKAVPLSKM